MSEKSVINEEAKIRRTELRRSSAVNSKQCNDVSNELRRLQRPITVSYELSEDIRSKEIEHIEKNYGGPVISQNAAKIIQTNYREYQMRKDYDKLKIEKRVSRKLDLPNISHVNKGLFHSKMSPTGHNQVVDTEFKKQNSYEDIVIEKAYEDWDSQISDHTLQSKVNSKKCPIVGMGNIDSGVDSRGTSSVSLTPSPTTTSSFSTVINTSNTISNSNMISIVCESSTSNTSNIDSIDNKSNQQHISSSISNSHSSNICDNSKQFNIPPINDQISPHVSKTDSTIGFCDLNNLYYNPNSTSKLVSNNNFSPNMLPGINPRLVGCQFPVTCLCQSVRKQKRLYRICLNIFNKNSVKGINKLISHKFVESSSNFLAKFLMTRKGLSRYSIGDYLGQIRDELASNTLRHVTRMIDMKNKEIDIALRLLLSYFQLPGESQKIKHILEEFQEAYVEQNKNWQITFRNKDTVLILAYAIIMLHTDMYNPNIRKQYKMTKLAFIQNLRNVDDNEDIDPNVLNGIYDRIRLEEIKTLPDHTNQVRKINSHFTGDLRPSNLVQPHRRLVCYCRVSEVKDQKKTKDNTHPREIFLFNDLLVVTKSDKSRKKGVVLYTCRNVLSLTEMDVYVFETQYCQSGILLKTSDKTNLTFNAHSQSDQKRLVDDLVETIAEIKEMDRCRIEEELNKQKMSQPKIEYYNNNNSHNTNTSNSPKLSNSITNSSSSSNIVSATGPVHHYRECVYLNNPTNFQSPHHYSKVSHQPSCNQICQPIHYFQQPQCINHYNFTNINNNNNNAQRRRSSSIHRQTASSDIQSTKLAQSCLYHNVSSSHISCDNNVKLKLNSSNTSNSSLGNIVDGASYNVYNEQYRISGDSGLQEDID